MRTSGDTAIGDRFKEFIRYSELKQLAYKFAALQQKKMFRTLAVLSFFPGEGKSLFCAALAMAYAETCRTNVLVVDTTTFQNKRSLVLKECFNGSVPEVHVMSLEELRRASAGSGQLSSGSRTEKTPALEGVVVREHPANTAITKENDLSLIKNAAEDRAKQYGLILLDTAPLNAKNKNNVDPLLVAHSSEASVLVVSQKLLHAPDLNAYLKDLEDPTLHLVGMISNEEFVP